MAQSQVHLLNFIWKSVLSIMKVTGGAKNAFEMPSLQLKVWIKALLGSIHSIVDGLLHRIASAGAPPTTTRGAPAKEFTLLRFYVSHLYTILDLFSNELSELDVSAVYDQLCGSSCVAHPSSWPGGGPCSDAVRSLLPPLMPSPLTGSHTCFDAFASYYRPRMPRC